MQQLRHISYVLHQQCLHMLQLMYMNRYQGEWPDGRLQHQTLWTICISYNSKSSPKANFITYDASFTLEHKRHHKTFNVNAPLCLLLDQVEGEWQPHIKTLANFSLILHAPKGRQVVQEMHASCSVASYWKAADHQMSKLQLHKHDELIYGQPVCVTADCLATLLKVQAVTKS